MFNQEEWEKLGMQSYSELLSIPYSQEFDGDDDYDFSATNILLSSRYSPFFHY